MPIEQSPCIVPCACSLGILISSVPDGWRIFWYESFGMTKLAEQSNVPLVFTRNTVGIPAVAVTTCGEYPPFAEISTYCTPSTIVAVPLAAAPDDCVASQNAPAMRRTLTTIETRIGLVIWSDVEERIDDTRRRERIAEIEQCQCDNDDARSLEEYPLPRFVRDVERTERKEREYGKGAERKDEHHRGTVHETPCRERIELHGLGEPARKDESPDADEEWREVEVVPAPAHHMA